MIAKEIVNNGFLNLEMYLKALELGAKTIDEYNIILNTNSPDFETALNVQNGGFPTYVLYKQALDLNIHFYSEMKLKINLEDQISEEISDKIKTGEDVNEET